MKVEIDILIAPVQGTTVPLSPTVIVLGRQIQIVDVVLMVTLAGLVRGAYPLIVTIEAVGVDVAIYPGGGGAVGGSSRYMPSERLTLEDVMMKVGLKVRESLVIT